MPRRHPAADSLWEPLTTPAAVAVFTTVLTRQPVSRAGIARLTGLSPAAVTKTVRPFIEAGYFSETASGPGPTAGPGRPSSPLEIQADREYFVGVKVSAEQLIGVVTDLRAQIRETLSHPLHSTDPATVQDAIVTMTDELRSRSPEYQQRCHSLGVAVAGDVDRWSGAVRYSPFLDWRDVPLGDALGRATGLSTVVGNDVHALATAEWWFGQGAGAESFALVVVGVGIGCALMLNGDMVSGSHGVAGELGHIPVGAGRTACRCGGYGCVETVASEQAIVSLVQAGTRADDLTLDDAIRLARAGQPVAVAAFDRAGYGLGLALAALANLVGPQRIVLSGSVLAAHDLFATRLRDTFAGQAFGAAGQCVLTVCPPPFAEWARGAAAVSIRALFSPAHHYRLSHTPPTGDGRRQIQPRPPEMSSAAPQISAHRGACRTD